MTARRVALLMLAVVAVLVFFADRTPVVVWDGGFELSVYILSDEPLSEVVLVPFGRGEDAEHYARWPVALADDYSGRVRLFTQSPQTVRVWLSGRDSITGREQARFQWRHLAVAARGSDGRWTGLVVDIPDCRESREVWVRLP